ncbi:hypothetical protein FQA39_LY08446 [Lamprigera yunnana]|nr:hypothetical protein FQA39_LY08446 [Lamprigera yunnana]
MVRSCSAYACTNEWKPNGVNRFHSSTLLSLTRMGDNNQHIVFGPVQEYFIEYESLGKYIFNCLKGRSTDDIVANENKVLEITPGPKLLDISYKYANTVVSIAPSKPHDVETSTEANFRNEIEPQAVPDSYTTNVDDSPYVEEPFQDSGSSYAPSEEYGSDSTSDAMEKVDGFTGKTLTCGRLLDESIKLAMAMDTRIRREYIVTVVSENSLNYYITVCSLLFLGVKINLLNPFYTIGELKHAFNITKSSTVFCSNIILHNILSLQQEVGFIKDIVLMEEDAKDFQCIKTIIDIVTVIDGFEPVSVDLKETVLLCMSSGTSGLPKCVELTHENFLPIIHYVRDSRYLSLENGDVTIGVLPLFHIYGLLIHTFAIFFSIKLVVMKHFKPNVFVKMIEENNVTKLFVVPQILHFMINVAETSKFSSLKDIIVGGAALGNDLFQKAIETGGVCAIQTHFDKFLTIGKLVINCASKVVDPKTNTPLKPYEKGELCFKSVSITKGYFNNAEETQKVFDSDGFYHTGDIGYYDENENFYISDRIKEIIKYKSFQVSPAELEDLILVHPAVKDCAVVGIPDERCGELPLAYVVRQPDANITESEIATFVAGNY